MYKRVRACIRERIYQNPSATVTSTPIRLAPRRGIRPRTRVSRAVPQSPPAIRRRGVAFEFAHVFGQVYLASFAYYLTLSPVSPVRDIVGRIRETSRIRDSMRATRRVNPLNTRVERTRSRRHRPSSRTEMTNELFGVYVMRDK